MENPMEKEMLTYSSQFKRISEQRDKSRENIWDILCVSNGLEFDSKEKGKKKSPGLFYVCMHIIICLSTEQLTHVFYVRDLCVRAL